MRPHPILYARRVLTLVQLEILDTAGAEQFTALNEVYITVSASSLLISRLLMLRSLVMDSFWSLGL